MTDAELTEKLIGKYFGKPYVKHTHWKSMITGELYDRTKYLNIEEEKRGWLPLPKEGYPYTTVHCPVV